MDERIIESRSNRHALSSESVIPANLRAIIQAIGVVDRYVGARLNSHMQWRRFSIAVLGLLMCSGYLNAQTPSGSDTGIEGWIMVSPAQPGPARANAPGSKPLTNAAFVVEDQKGEVTSFTTDDQGHFRKLLAPGHYTISLKGKTGGIGHFGPFEADVLAGKMTTVHWNCDSGLR